MFTENIVFAQSCSVLVHFCAGWTLHLQHKWWRCADVKPSWTGASRGGLQRLYEYSRVRAHTRPARVVMTWRRVSVMRARARARGQRYVRARWNSITSSCHMLSHDDCMYRDCWTNLLICCCLLTVVCIISTTSIISLCAAPSLDSCVQRHVLPASAICVCMVILQTSSVGNSSCLVMIEWGGGTASIQTSAWLCNYCCCYCVCMIVKLQRSAVVQW